MKIYFIILISFLLAPALAFAASTDVTMSGSSIISVGGYSLVVSGTATFDSITVSSDSFTIDLSAGSQLIVTSADRRSFTTSPTTFTSFTCGSSESTLTLSNNTEVKTTVTVTPSSSACTASGSSGGGGIIGGGGGGGGGGYSAPAVPQQVSTPAVAVVTVPSVPSVVSVSPVFASALKIGMTGADVKRLQQVLNSDSDTQIAASGAGSPGNETAYFGSLTMKALQKFQTKYGIVSSGMPETTGYGALGPKTRAKLAEVFAKAEPKAPEVAKPSPVAVSVSPVFSAGLSKGMSSADVKRLQQLLNSDFDTKIAESGVGSPGNETEYFGSLTEKAIQKFQVKYGIAKEGDPGYGYVGPKTRTKIQEAFSGVETPAAPTVPVVPTAPAPAPQPVTPPAQTEIPDFLKLIPAPKPQ